MWIVYVETPNVFEEIWEDDSQEHCMEWCIGFLAHHKITF